MPKASQNQLTQSAPESATLLPLQSKYTRAKKALRNYGNCSEFAKKLLCDLPVPAKAWAGDLGLSEDYVRQMKRGDRNIPEELSEKIVNMADEYTTVYLSWKLKVDHFRQRGEIL